MKYIFSAFLAFFFVNLLMLTPLAEANVMRFVLVETEASPIRPVLNWWWDDADDTSNDKEKDPTAFKLDSVLELEAKLNESILGQSFAISEVTNNLIAYQAGINDPTKPIGVFLFAGPTGVGKTQLAKELSKELLGSEKQLLRFDMGEYANAATIWTLIGSSRGYQDSHKGGILTEALRNKKNTIILLDEVEKAAPEVRKLFLSAFDEGRITSGLGEIFDLNTSLFILTTNIASEDILALSNQNLSSEQILPEVAGEIAVHLTPELYNRLTPVIFKAIPYALYPKIIDRELFLITKRLQTLKQLQLIFDPSVSSYLLSALQSNQLGVRPLKRLIERQVIGNLSRFIVVNKPKPNSSLKISVEGDSIVIES